MTALLAAAIKAMQRINPRVTQAEAIERLKEISLEAPTKAIKDEAERMEKQRAARMAALKEFYHNKYKSNPTKP